MSESVLLLSEIDRPELEQLLADYGMTLAIVPESDDIPGSFWGECEAGLVGTTLYAWMSTPVHSIMHEFCHFICMDDQRKAALHTNAGGTLQEECATCYLQIVLSNRVTGMGSQRMWSDMDRWGYSFRLGSAQRWFEEDADDARQWLLDHQKITASHMDDLLAVA